jgi:hypothetical protein
MLQPLVELPDEISPRQYVQGPGETGQDNGQGDQKEG